jgi:peptidoglycan hydrolase-like protein with peptidoglycan-binding domain
MKNYLSKILAGLVLGAGLLLTSVPAQASTLTSTQVQAILSLLQSFNADPATLNSVAAALGASSSAGGCPALSYNLYLGLTNTQTAGQVSQLQSFLGVSPTGYFGTQTRAAVANFQQRYNVQPITGGVGPLTRAAILSVCGGSTPSSNTFNFNTAFSIGVGQIATESTLGQLTIQLLSVNGSIVQVTLGQNCARGTQCFYYSTQTVTLQLDQPITFQNYSIDLVGVSANSAMFFTSNSNSSMGGTPLSTPTINSITPTSGVVDSTVMMYGSGFTSDNIVHFGSGGQQHVVSPNGTTLTYTIPSQIGPICLSGQACPEYLQLVTPGTYPLSVSNVNGQSGSVSFTVTGQSIGGNVISFTQPLGNQSFNSGQTLPISWTASPNVPSGTNVILDLYTAAGSKVGTIAISATASGSYSWQIPNFPQNYACTMQYPNGLCGTNIPTGQYYILATATSNGLNTIGATTYGSAQSSIFTINQE